MEELVNKHNIWVGLKLMKRPGKTGKGRVAIAVRAMRNNEGRQPSKSPNLFMVGTPRKVIMLDYDFKKEWTENLSRTRGHLKDFVNPLVRINDIIESLEDWNYINLKSKIDLEFRPNKKIVLVKFLICSMLKPKSLMFPMLQSLDLIVLIDI